MHKKTIQQHPAYRIVARGERFAVYDKHSKFRVICDTLADAQRYVDVHTARPQRRVEVEVEEAVSV